MAKIEFKRGDGATHYFSIPTTTWSPGGKLRFVAKPAVDDDNTDANAKIDRQFDDTVAVNDGTNVTYTLYFPPSDTNSIIMNGDTKVTLVSEFQLTYATGVPSTFPGNDTFITCIIYADIARVTP
jgi:hypothetical protein